MADLMSVVLRVLRDAGAEVLEDTSILDTPESRERTEALLRAEPNITCCGDPTCHVDAYIRKVRADMVERGDLVMPPEPAPAPTLSQDEAERLVADFEGDDV